LSVLIYQQLRLLFFYVTEGLPRAVPRSGAVNE
jgi:hypothetical protein